MRHDPIIEVAERWAAIAAAARRLEERVSAEEQEAAEAFRVEAARHARVLEEIEERQRNLLRNVSDRLERRRSEAKSLHQEQMVRLEGKLRASLEEIERRAESSVREAAEALQQALWLADSVFESGEQRPKASLEEVRGSVRERLAALDTIVSEATRQTRRFRQAVPACGVTPALSDRVDPLMVLGAQIAFAADAASRLRRLGLPGLFRGPILLVPAIFAAMGGVAVAWGLGFRDGLLGIGASVGAALIALVAIVLWFPARERVRRAWEPLHRAVVTARAAADAALVHAERECAETERSAVERLSRERAAAQQRFAPAGAEAERKRLERIAEVRRVVEVRRAEIDGELHRALQESQQQFDSASERGRAALAAELAAEARLHEERETGRKTAQEAARLSREGEWIVARDAFGAWVEARTAAFRSEREIWERPIEVPVDFPSGILVGSLRLDMSDVPHGAPSGPTLAWPGASAWDVPLERSLVGGVSTLIEAPTEAREEALVGVQAMIARLLVRCPPGKVRLTLMDPVGLGQGFAGFMHLADEMEQLVGERIWTDPRQIEQKLVDLTEHMETVIQKYLRDEFETIADYNAQAGQLAEPLRVVVMADFPAGLNDGAVRRLASVLQSGARCGVHLILLHDPARPVPDGLKLEDVHRSCRRIFWRAGGFRVEEHALESVAVRLERPPAAARLQECLRAVGQLARKASVVQVPFSAIEPARERFWTASAAASLSVPIGRSGATQLQSLVLGEGTRQHVLLAGKTGSGKSTLLNAMIVNLASWFSPDELELWLIDFKKGVEFKAYARHRLPHARAVAVESDREFGLSVLQGLDSELKRRGDLFRSTGVQDLAGWRRLDRPDSMPRALLIVDEFQELFVEDDKVAQEAALLLDRLVRQGRAFGMHVILGSQTLGGAYALPRTTMGQMGVRIALQCNEADAALILSDDNTAARLLSRPGEAIYNDAGGLVEGNSPFQVVWLGDREREERVRALAERGASTAARRPAMIVFDGTSRSDLAACRPLRERMGRGERLVVPVHLGEPVAIRDATVAPLRRQSGSNLLLVGQSERMALGLSLATLASFRAAAGEGAEVLLLDGSPADSPEAGVLRDGALALGLSVAAPSYRDVDDAIRRVGETVARRIESGRTDEAPTLLLVHGLQRFRSLRRDEDDFSFSASDGPPKADRVLAGVLRDGPGVGVHVVIWVDTAPNLQRSVDRAAMREFDLRVLMQMGANDSAALIDSPSASRLGADRALLFSEERGTIERFRPYDPPSVEELAALVRG